MKRNPFDKFIKGETKIHIQVAEYLQYQYPNVMFHHSPNEAKRTPFERYLVSKMGVSAGFPDFIIYGFHNTIALELKYKDNTPTDAQLKWLHHFQFTPKTYSFVAWSFESAKLIIDKYIGEHINNYKDFYFTTSYVVDTQDILPAKIRKNL